MIPEKKDIQAFAKQQSISGDYSDMLKNDKVKQSCDPWSCTYLHLRIYLSGYRSDSQVKVSVHEQNASNCEATTPSHMLLSPSYMLMLT